MNDQIRQVKQSLQEVGQFYQNQIYITDSILKQNDRSVKPAIHSRSFITEQGEQILQINNQNIWQSLTYPGEFVKVQERKIVGRMNSVLQLTADFDYRFYPVEVTESVSRSLFDECKSSLGKVSQTFFDLSRLTYECEYESMKKEILRLYDRLQILIGYPNADLADPSKVVVYDIRQFEIYSSFIQELLKCLELCEKKTIIPKTQYRYKEGSNVFVNIFSGSCFNVSVFRSSSVFVHESNNVIVQRSSDVNVSEVHDVSVYDSRQVFVQSESYDVNVIKSSNIFIGKRVNHVLLNGVALFVAHDDSTSGGRVRVLYEGAQVIIQSGSMKNTICDLTFFGGLTRTCVIVEKNSCNNSVVSIKNALNYSYLYLNEESVNDGWLKILPKAFQVAKICFIPSGVKWIQFPIDIKSFYYKKCPSEMNILHGTEYMIQNSIYLLSSGSYDDGLETHEQSPVKSDYLLSQPPARLEGKGSFVYGFKKNGLLVGKWGPLK